MPIHIDSLAQWCSVIIEFVGIGIITVASVFSVFYALYMLYRRTESEVLFRNVRQTLGRGILLGLEFLVAGDIIHTVALELNFESLGALAIVVVIRTFLSFSLEVELTGTWPWHESKERTPPQDVDSE